MKSIVSSQPTSSTYIECCSINFLSLLQIFAAILAVSLAEPGAKPEAKADPYLLYGGYYGGYPYTYHGYYGYGYPYYGKRSADAEATPEAKADPAILYGGYYGYPYAYGYGGYYGYPRYLIGK